MELFMPMYLRILKENEKLIEQQKIIEEKEAEKKASSKN